MSTDITTMFTKERNMMEGRRGYLLWKREKEDAIRPDKYGMFLNDKRKRKRNRSKK